MREFTTKKISVVLSSSKLEAPYNNQKKGSKLNITQEEVLKIGFMAIKQIPVDSKKVIAEIIETYEKTIKF